MHLARDVYRLPFTRHGCSVFVAVDSHNEGVAMADADGVIVTEDAVRGALYELLDIIDPVSQPVTPSAASSPQRRAAALKARLALLSTGAPMLPAAILLLFEVVAR